MWQVFSPNSTFSQDSQCTVPFYTAYKLPLYYEFQMPGLKLPPLVHYIITVKLNGCLWNSAQWLWTQYHRMMIITHCHALCGGGTFAYFTQVWQSAEWHYRSKQGNLCNLISANKQPPRNRRGSVTVTGTAICRRFMSLFLSFFCFVYCVFFLASLVFIRIDHLKSLQHICTNRTILLFALLMPAHTYIQMTSRL